MMKLAFCLKSKRLARMEVMLTQLLTQGEWTHMDLTTLTAKVANLTGTVESASVLLSELGGLIRQNANDPAALQALADQIDKDQAELAAAVAANPLPGAQASAANEPAAVNPADHEAI